MLLGQGHIFLGKTTLVPLASLYLDVHAVVADLYGVDVDATGLGEGQEGAEAQEVDCTYEGEHRRPRACGLDEIPREIYH